ncbi:cytochrome P450 monooxygenase [Apiospora rasikravindrae]|uniref:Cytochrome P450 monooxygenase n=1 Tax=Apiospora rasikravindrae TaxID=990691 RepID=A0ABR1SLR4_9PEZI
MELEILSSLPPAALGLIAVVVIYIVSTILSYRRLSHIPGPWFSSISYLPMIGRQRSGRMNEQYTAITARYGFSNLARIGPNDVLTADPDRIRHMSGTRSPYVKSGWYNIMNLDPDRQNGIGTLDTAVHDRFKAQTAKAYAGKDNSLLNPDLDEQVANLVESLRAKCRAGQHADMGKLAQLFTLDSIAKVGFGEEFGNVREDRDVLGYGPVTSQNIPFLAMCGDVPWLRNVMLAPWPRRLMGPKETDENGIGKLLSVTKKIVATRFGPKAVDRQDMLGSFVRHGLDQEDCNAEVVFQIIAGADTTATAIRATLLYIIAIPRVYSRLQAEIDAGIREGRISDEITLQEAKALPYLQAVIQEGLRIWPPFVGLVMKQVPKGGDTFKGVFLPEGTRVAHSTWAVTRNKEIFGDDAEMFRPERWLVEEQPDPEKRARMTRAAELVFGYGRWQCSGKTVALLELNKVFVQILRNFDLESVNPAKPWVSASHNVWVQKDMWVKLTERK